MAGAQKVVNLNALCPYYTMYPLDLPLRVLANRTYPQEWLLDPFCGRGTTNFAARLVGLSSVGIDSNPIAVAIAMAKFLRVPADAVVAAAEAALAETNSPLDIPADSSGQAHLAIARVFRYSARVTVPAEAPGRARRTPQG
jgi:hypothetical protein